MNDYRDATDVNILTRLRASTRPEHDAIETALDLANGASSCEAYCHLLKRFYGFYRPLEVGLSSSTVWLVSGLDPVERRKAAWLESDLCALGVDDLAGLPDCPDLPPHTTVAAAFGCLYVLEGATLGGQVISRAIENTLGFRPDSGGRFFHGYGDGTGPMWQGFRSAITDCVITAPEADEVIIAAKETFSKLHRWLLPESETR